MTHTASNESLDQTMDGTAEQKQPTSPGVARKGWGFLMGGVLLLAGGAWGILQLTRSPHSPEPTLTQRATTVETLTIRPQLIANTLELSGTIHSVDQATLSTRVSGRITYFPFKAGDRFHKGDIVARIDVKDIAAQANQARSGIAQAQAELARSQASLSQLRSQKLSAQAALGLAQITQTRSAQLRADGAVSQANLDQANAALKQAKEQVAQAEAGIQQSQAAIAQSQATINQAKAQVAAASANESYGTVVAPFNGIVTEKLAYLGETTNPYSMNGTALLKIENPDRLQIEIPVPEENLRFVHVGQTVQVRVDAVSGSFKGTIGQIVPASDPLSRSFLVKIPLNSSLKLISGMFGRIALPLDGTEETILIPKNALIQRGQLQGVYVVDTSAQHPTAVLRWVKTGQQHKKQVEIVSGLMKGDRIIATNINQLSDGQPINPQP
ncbi:efflux RND transporter periplasmic adaptor subunit [Aetokthonos hydrillicola Thurmond2011]|jgi:multidrug efflux pump subunit AcrA (membrane-fusion protein)|uniref:Efflux RND transporter periplasmic adaptor subunit n=1 Tax=Aetokthonos hydrillicola Thurmond2011 TaxID=2712845 RepID=A0AAP5IHX7_9CYAN|nr:efflux RND transporter periplasmic adaptor subunit [Aetokthonos hydrillicola]MBO3459623.1 efflux RND transporter periplasmic adaptor subunit [Aetokthonos hydrillicola CCALA 1050]MBW4588985.1 efflux RND transporter periplasmic adaptor subunit [Aetokthonos hydrillicola CCALA 1050]MDR9900060.1 efflux RND transporter periplasmic adaptor subunit [Aetokthonos hydrillicola Thurmond2011]